MSDQGYDLVPFVAPSERLTGIGHVHESECERSDSDQFHANHLGCGHRNNRRVAQRQYDGSHRGANVENPVRKEIFRTPLECKNKRGDPKAAP